MTRLGCAAPSRTTTSARQPGASDPRSASPSARAGVRVAGRTAYAIGTPAATARATMSATWLVPPAIEPGHAVVDDDGKAAEDVGAVAHAGGGHRVGDERDVVGADEVEDGAHRV